ncbi:MULTISPECIES: class I SAM-dependent methyltransferase [Sporomusa]|jgi:2-polyprenyl-3-methyl-5-hydroxy-6-metoxy-1,4-benzoquinol methylase|uniref:class I SAM-dependent methyltransferase n=1 Tax=Sporomusa TaxID=2375 RepID=UPI00202F89FB|nr:class I SAM-dependent methyltransferase [Sporomusa sphaeroides]MCM0758655.1 class I SAM-dependent methyltransferase [Sporomusa sphaeroides DSM 2875]
MEKNYYAQKLNSSKLFEVYQTQLARVKQYIDAEINFVCNELPIQAKVLEMGAGYGRIMKELAPFAASVTGIDISENSVEFGKEYLKDCPNCEIKVMDAHKLEFSSTFDVILCLQNGISAMKGDPLNLINQGMQLLSRGGKAYFSSYSPKFWEHRLAWFHEQADKGLLGEIDLEKTKPGIIVCKDGFAATTYSQEDMEQFGQAVGYTYQIQEVDNSSIFLILEKNR